MSVLDRVESAKHSLSGSPIGKAVAKATSREIIGPKKKHVDYLLLAINYENVNIPNLVDMMFERTQNSSWIVTFKGLITFHHLMSNGNERFIQCLASRSSTWMLQTFHDKSGVQGYDMSHSIRRYSHYLSEKAFIYRTVGYDFCRIQRGKEKGVLRNMDTTKLVKAIPEIQKQLDALISTEITGSELTNGVITAAFMLLFRDLIRLFACYNDGIINLLEKYFDMKKPDCKAALEIYKKFVNRMDRVSSFLKVAEDVGIDKGDIPDLTQAPSSLLTALENHLLSLEKGKAFTPPSKPITLPTFNVSANVESSVNVPWNIMESTDGATKDALEMERRALHEYEKQKQSPAPALAPPVNQTRISNRPAHVAAQPELLLTQSAQSSPPQTSGANDLFELNNSLFSNIAQTSSMTRSSTFPMADQKPGDLWAAENGTWAQQNAIPVNTNPFNTNNNSSFSPVFQNSGQNGNVLLDDFLTPEPVGGVSQQQQQQSMQTSDDVDPGDLSSSLARAARSLDDLSLNARMQRVQTQKGQHQWKPPQPQVKTGGSHFQGVSVAKMSMPPVSSQPGWAGSAGGPFGMQTYPGSATMGMQPQYGNQAGVAQPGNGVFPMATPYNQMNAPIGVQDPFGPVPGTQVRF